ncbi:MAG TPA: choice-of-anchor X domain-containing protein [Phycisphaerales bacterium]|nr:choice-of-anchor X domain-containing protein [Phycisphaerales bacterium]
MDARTSSSVTAALVLCTIAGTSTAQLRISQVGKGSGLDPNAYNGNYIELHNAGSSPESLTGKSIQWASSPGGASWTRFNLSGEIPAGGCWLVRLTSTNAGPDPSVGFGVPFVADQNRVGFNGTFTSVTFGNSGGKVVLSDSTTTFTTNGCVAPDAAHVIDLVAWDDVPSTAACHEGSACALIPVPGAFAGGVGSTAVTRTCGGLQDTNDNLADFNSFARPPRSSAYAGPIDAPAVSGMTQVTGQAARGTTTGYAGQTVRFTAGASACSGTIQSVSINLSSIGGSPAQAMVDDGTQGDLVSGDGIYSYLYTIPAASIAPLGTYLLPIAATDTSARTGLGQAPLIVAPTPPPHDACANAEVFPAGPLPYFGSMSGNLVSASPITLVGTSCTTNSGSAGTSRDVWYSFTPAESGFYTITTCNSVTAPGLFTSMSTNLTVFPACPAEGTTDLSPLSVACSASNCSNFIGGAPSTIFSLPMDAGVPYIIRVAKAGSGTGIVAGPFRLDIMSESFGACCFPNGSCSTLLETSCATAGGTFWGQGTTCSNVTCPPPAAPANNECVDAVVLTTSAPAIGTTYGATGTDISTCDDTTWDVWYSYTPDQSGTVHVDVARLSGLETPALAAYTTCPPAADTNTACMNIPVQGAANALEFSGASGTTYYIRVATHFSQRVDFSVTVSTQSACDPIDFNADGLFPDTADIDDFLSVFSGGPCSTGTCGDIDFNNDGLYPDTADIDALLSVFSGGPCL